MAGPAPTTHFDNKDHSAGPVQCEVGLYVSHPCSLPSLKRNHSLIRHERVPDADTGFLLMRANQAFHAVVVSINPRICNRLDLIKISNALRRCILWIMR